MLTFQQERTETAAKLLQGNIVSFPKLRWQIWSDLSISREVLELASVFVELELAPKGFRSHMSQFARKAANINS